MSDIEDKKMDVHQYLVELVDSEYGKDKGLYYLLTGHYDGKKPLPGFSLSNLHKDNHLAFVGGTIISAEKKATAEQNRYLLVVIAQRMIESGQEDAFRTWLDMMNIRFGNKVLPKCDLPYKISTKKH